MIYDLVHRVRYAMLAQMFTETKALGNSFSLLLMKPRIGDLILLAQPDLKSVIQLYVSTYLHKKRRKLRKQSPNAVADECTV